jgi:hypothetical protein
MSIEIGYPEPTKEMTPDEIAEMGKPISLDPHISDFEFFCQKCIDAGDESICTFITEPYFKMWRMPYWENGVYKAGLVKWFFHIRCKNDHEYTIHKDVRTAFDVDELQVPKEDSAGEGEYTAGTNPEGEADKLHDEIEEAMKAEEIKRQIEIDESELNDKPKHIDIELVENIEVSDGRKKDNGRWSSEGTETENIT